MPHLLDSQILGLKATAIHDARKYAKKKPKLGNHNFKNNYYN
jgi:hypothetical protein